jgi:hypothetical protein
MIGGWTDDWFEKMQDAYKHGHYDKAQAAAQIAFVMMCKGALEEFIKLASPKLIDRSPSGTPPGTA